MSDPSHYRQERLFDSVTIALVGKYTDMQDSYMSVVKSLEHSAFRCSRKLILKVSVPVLFVPCVKLTGNFAVGSGC